MSETTDDPLPDTHKPNDSGAVAARFLNAFKAVEAIGKNRQNDYHDFAYRGIDDVMDALHDVLANNGLFYFPRLVDHQIVWATSANNKQMQFATLHYCFDFYDENGNYLTVGPVIGQAADTDDKGPMKALSQSAKYALLQAFCVPVGQDDADAKSPVSQDRTQYQPGANAPPSPSSAQPQQRQQRQQVQQSSGSGGGQGDGQPEMATKKQVGFLLNHLQNELGFEDHHIANLVAGTYGQNKGRVGDLTKREASNLIQWVQVNPELAKQEAGANGGDRNAPDEPEEVPLPEEPPQQQVL